MKIYILPFFVLLMEISVAGQTGSVIPPSPNMATLQRFGDYPVNLSTGLVDITIPLYEIKLKDYTFPVTIKFHASGRRWSGNFSSMGVGWSLDASGYVSREIRERPDEDYLSLEMTADSITNRNTYGIELAYDRLVNADMSIPNGHLAGEGDENKKEDSEHDMFSFGANGISGKFVVDKWGNALPLSYCPYKIGAQAGGNGCDITDEKGTYYRFGRDPGSIESVWNTTAFGSKSYVTGTFLTRIERPSGENISFTYKQTRMELISGTGNDLKYLGEDLGYADPYALIGAPEDCLECENFSKNISDLHDKDLTSYNHYDISSIKEISFPNGKIIFDYDSLTVMLKGFHVLDGSGHELRSGTFTYIQTPGTVVCLGISYSNSLSLDSLVIRNAAGEKDQVYRFDYYDDPLPVNKPDPGVTNTDWWGYCNTTGGNVPPYDPAVDPYMYGVTPDKKTPDFYPVRSGMLKMIHYPTGGTTEFDYELNQYNDGHIYPQNGPGLRIQKLVTDDGSGINKITKLYKYGQNENGMGYLYHQPNARDFKFKKIYHIYFLNNDVGGYVADYSITSFLPFPITTMREAYQQPVYYDHVVEYTVSQKGDNNGKTAYFYALPQYFFSGTSIRKKEWTGGQLINKSTWLFRSTDTICVERINNNYSEFHHRKIPQVRIWRNSFLKYDDAGNQRVYERSRALSGESIYTYYNFPIESAATELTYTEHTVSDDQGHDVTSTTQYFYDNPDYVLPSRVVSSTSRGELMSEETRYVSDLYHSLNDMFNKNWLFPVETSAYLMNPDGSNKRLISSKFTKWDQEKGVPLSVSQIESRSPLTNFVPAHEQSFTLVKDTNYVEKYTYVYGRLGTLLQESRPGDISISYLWDATGSYPLAQVKGAAYSQISSLDGMPANFSSSSLNSSLKSLVPSSLIQTYSYKPLIGITSITDTNGINTFYEYDSFGRLMNIRDKDNNILKHYDYHYKQ